MPNETEIMMAAIKAPLFRKSMNGYKKEDVNNYILTLNRTVEENKKSYEKALENCNARAADDYQRICDLSTALKSEEDKNALLEKDIAELRKESEQKDEIIASLGEQVKELEELRAKLASYEADAEDKQSKADYYDSLCSKAGEILVIASNTAEDILNRANGEAVKIVSDANCRKDKLLQTFSDSAIAAADDINGYIKTAVDECIKKINRSVKEVTSMAKPSAGTAVSQKHKALFVNEKKQ